MLARVRGERIVRVIEAGADARGPFLVTEYAAGPSLAASVEAIGPFGPEGLSALAAGLAEALADIHAAGVVHRDLKPSNVILAADGPKVIDFGIARVLDSVSLTRTGMTIGSVGYTAPEQVWGQAGPAADIFAWAVTVAYAASGQPPFGTGPTDAVMYRILHAQPDLGAVPATLRPVLEAALAKEPGDRPAAHEILDYLTACSAAPAGPLAVPAVLSPPTATQAPPVAQVPQRPAAGGCADRGPRLTFRQAMIGIPAGLLVVITALALVVLGGRPWKEAGPARPRGTSLSQTLTAGPFGLYPGQRDRGVFQTISRMSAYGSTIVTTGTEVSDGVVRQQFFFSADGGRSWELAPVRTASGGQPPLGYQAARVAGRPARLGGDRDRHARGPLDQPERPVLDASGHSRAPDAARRQHPGADRHRPGFPGGGPGGGRPGRDLDVAGRRDLAADDGRAARADGAGPDPGQRVLGRLLPERHGDLRAVRRRPVRDVAEHRRRVGLDAGDGPGHGRRRGHR